MMESRDRLIESVCLNCPSFKRTSGGTPVCMALDVSVHRVIDCAHWKTYMEKEMEDKISKDAESIEDAVRNPGSPGPDPWKNISVGMCCRSCMWFVRKGDGALGRCRRHSPTMSGYPAVFEHDWCGDHKLDETKL